MIKSNNPHLAGEEISHIWSFFGIVSWLKYRTKYELSVVFWEY